MMSKWFSWRLIPIVFFLFLCIFLWRGLALNPHELPSVQVGKSLPDFNIALLDDPQKRLTLKDIEGKPLLLNVWSSWCAVCQQEQVILMQLAAQGVPIYGIDYKDEKKAAKLWLNQWGNPYQQVGIDKKGKLAIDLGVYGVPETFVIDKQGIIRYRHAGIITQRLWKKTLHPLMDQLEKEP